MSINNIAQFRTFKQAVPPNRGTDPSSEKRAEARSPVSLPNRLFPGARDSARFRARLYPNGEFGIGYIPKKQKSAEERRQERGIVQGYQSFLEGRPYFLENGEILFDTTDMVTLLEPNLDGSPELSQSPKRYGLKGISSYGRRVVRNIGFMLQQEFGKRRLSMGTLTIPSLSPDAMKVICSNWAGIQKKFFQECKRRYKRLGLPWKYVSVTEIQPKRWEERREVGLHIHFLFPSFRLYKRGMFSLSHDWTRRTWKRIIENTLNTHLLGGGDDNVIPLPMYNCEPVRKDAAGYLAKYMTKGSDIVQEVCAEMGEEYLPKQWWSCDSLSRKSFKKSVLVSSGLMAEYLLSHCRHPGKNDFKILSIATISGGYLHESTGDPQDFVIGYGGALQPHLDAALRKIHKKHG